MDGGRQAIEGAPQACCPSFSGGSSGPVRRGRPTGKRRDRRHGVGAGRGRGGPGACRRPLGARGAPGRPPAAPGARQSETRARAAMGARDALIGAGREAVIVWGRDGASPRIYGNAEELIDSCLAGPDATGCPRRSTRWRKKARPSPCRRTTRTNASSRCAAAPSAPSWPLAGRGTEGQSLARFPIRARCVADPRLAARPHAVAAVGQSRVSRRDGRRRPATRRRTAARARKIRTRSCQRRALRRRALEAKRFTVVGGQRRALAFTHVPIADGDIVGTAIDVTDIASAEARLQQHIDARPTRSTSSPPPSPSSTASRSSASTIAPSRSFGACRKAGSSSSRPTAKSSTACATRANCRSSATIRRGNASASRSTSSRPNICRKNCGTCPAARRCASWRSRILSAG